MLNIEGVCVKEVRDTRDSLVLPFAHEFDLCKGDAINLLLLANKSEGDDFVRDNNPAFPPRSDRSMSESIQSEWILFSNRKYKIEQTNENIRIDTRAVAYQLPAFGNPTQNN